MAKSRGSKAISVVFWLIVIVAIVLAAAFAFYRDTIDGYGKVSTSYTARVACSCRFVAGRSLSDCAKDKLAGMELVTLVEDVDAKSVTARFPLVTATTASYREGFGCVLEEWES